MMNLKTMLLIGTREFGLWRVSWGRVGNYKEDGNAVLVVHSLKFNAQHTTIVKKRQE